MKLFEKIPDGITVDGKYYPCKFDFRNVLKMLEIMQREDIYPDARDYLCLKCVVSHRIAAKNVRKVYDALVLLLFGQRAEKSGKRLTSFEQDAPLIRAAFRQVYRIDLFREKLTWFEFTDYLQNLPEGNRYEDVIGIRARPIPAPNKYNAKEREWLIKAKQDVAIHLTDIEQQKKYDADVTQIFTGLMSMIPKEVTQNGE